MKSILNIIQSDSIYQKNIEYEDLGSGHPEGKVKIHIADLEKNLDLLVNKGKISNATVYWKLKFLIHIHDSFKAEAVRNTLPTHPRNHAFLAREYASKYTDDVDLLNMLQYHDENYTLWKEFSATGDYNKKEFFFLLEIIQDWDLFLSFIIVDGCTKGKEYKKLYWFIEEVKKFKITIVETSWVLLISNHVK